MGKEQHFTFDTHPIDRPIIKGWLSNGRFGKCIMASIIKNWPFHGCTVIQLFGSFQLIEIKLIQGAKQSVVDK